MSLWQHKKTGTNYIVLLRKKVRVPVIGLWVGLVEYTNCQDYSKATCVVYVRLEWDFNRKFRLVQNESNN